MHPATVTRHADRAPPLVEVLGRRPEPEPGDLQEALVDRVRRWAGAAAGAAWTGVLAGLLLGLGRVPVPEALLWSLLAGIAVARVTYGVTGRLARWLLEPVQVEMSLPDPAAYRDAFPARAARWGLRPRRSAFASCRVHPTWAPGVPPLVAEWVGAGVRLHGPRFAVRAALRWALP